MTDRNTSIRRDQLKPIRYDDFDATNAPSDNYVPSYDVGTGKFTWIPVTATDTFGISIDAIGAILAGSKAYLTIPYACTITKWTLLADGIGSLKIDIWKDTYANYPPTDADTITGGNEPELTGAQKNEDETLSGWTTSVSAGDTLIFNVDSCSGISDCSLVLYVTKP